VGSTTGNLGGPAAKFHKDKLGIYILNGFKNGRSVYRHQTREEDIFLHFNEWGLDLVCYL
jgi:hypothetical protein